MAHTQSLGSAASRVDDTQQEGAGRRPRLLTLRDRKVCTHEATCTRGLVSLSAIGFNVETVTYKNLKFQVWDLGGQTSIRYAVNIGVAYVLWYLDT